MNEVALIVITALVTSGLSTVFSYYKEKKFANAKYTEKVLVDLYIPIYKIMMETPDPVSPYEGIDDGRISRIRVIIDNNPELTDPRLNGFLYVLEETVYYEALTSELQYTTQEEYQYGEKLYDTDRKMFYYILKSFNATRKSLGLPYDKRYGSSWSYLYRKVSETRLDRRNRRMWGRFNRQRNNS